MIERLFEAVVSPATVSAASSWVRDLADELKLGEEDAYRVDLVLTEVVQNIVDHAGLGQCEIPLAIRARADAGQLHIEVIDAGKPFDPLSVGLQAMPERIEDAVPGGLGLPLIRGFTEGLHYVRCDDRNYLKLDFELTAPAAMATRSARVARGRERRRNRGVLNFPLGRADGTVVERDQRAAGDRRLTGFISRSDLFRDVAYDQVEEIVASFPIKDLAHRSVLLRPGDRNDRVLVVLRGTLRVLFDSLDSPEHVEISEGGCVGEMSIIDDRPISAFVVAEPGCRLLLIDAASFLERIISIAQVARNLVSTFSERMRRSDEIIIGQLKAKLELEQLQRDLRYARTIQSSMLPHEPLFNGRPEVDCVGLMRAARDVGGDFYDALFLDASRIFVAIGDVCNKGLPAALFMVRAITTLRSEVSQPGGDMAQHLASAVERLNRHLNQSNEAQQFLTFFCGVLDLDSQTLTYVNAGHNASLLATRGTSFNYLAEPVNPIVGMVDGLAYEAAQTVMPVGSTLVLYTDGVTEAEDPAGAMFGEERLQALVRGAPRASAQQLVDDIVAAVDGFAAGAPQSDDITVLALRFRTPAHN